MKTFFLKLSAGLENLFLSNNRFIYWLLIIALKPLLTFFLYPADTRDLNEQNDFMFHIAYIYEYELIAFLYSLVLVYLLYLFIHKKNIDKRLFSISLIVTVMMIILINGYNYRADSFLQGLIGFKYDTLIFNEDVGIWISILTGVLIYLINSKKK